MFDDIRYKTVCPNCSDIVDSFQSKDGDCVLDILEPNDVDNFYSFCKKCECRITFTRKEESNYPRCSCCNQIVKPNKWIRTIYTWQDKKLIELEQFTKEVKI